MRILQYRQRGKGLHIVPYLNESLSLGKSMIKSYEGRAPALLFFGDIPLPLSTYTGVEMSSDNGLSDVEKI